MSTMGMYRVKWPATRFGPKYAKRKPKLAAVDPLDICEELYNNCISCMHFAVEAEGDTRDCDSTFIEFWDCMNDAEGAKAQAKAAKYRLMKFMRGRDSFGIII